MLKKITYVNLLLISQGDFDEVESKEGEELLPKWAELQAREMRILTTMPPRNFLEDMARMTDRGELWHFPIDNEQVKIYSPFPKPKMIFWRTGGGTQCLRLQQNGVSL